METELNTLETKLALLVQVSRRLRAENHELRQNLAQALSQNRQLSDKIGAATSRLEKVLAKLPEESA